MVWERDALRKKPQAAPNLMAINSKDASSATAQLSLDTQDEAASGGSSRVSATAKHICMPHRRLEATIWYVDEVQHVDHRHFF